MVDEGSPRTVGRLCCLASGYCFLAVACLAVGLGVSGFTDFRNTANLAVLFGTVGVFHLLMVPWARRVARFEAIPPGQTKEAWAEGTTPGSPGSRSWLPIVDDKVRLGVGEDGLHVRSNFRTGVAIAVLLLAGNLLGGWIATLTDNIRGFEEARGPLTLFVAVPLLLAVAGLLAFDPPTARHDILRPWRHVARIVETKDALFIHWTDGSPPLVASFPRYALRRILPLLAAHATVDEYVRPPQASGTGEPAAIDARTAASLDRALDGMRKLDA